MTATRKEEYESLRQELLQHQERRLPILNLMLVVAVGLCGTALELQNPYLPLGALLLLFSARIQLAETQYGVQRIASYLRVLHEENNLELNWETASFAVRRASLQKQSPLWNVVPFSPLDAVLFVTSFVANVIAISLALAYPVYNLYICAFVGLIWLVLWIWYGRKTRTLLSMQVDKAEEDFWRAYKRSFVEIVSDD